MTGESVSSSGWNPDHLKVLEDEKIQDTRDFFKAENDRLDEKIQALRDFFGAELKRLEAVITGQERAVTLLGTANQIAQDKFESTVKDGFVKQNEFRGSLDDLGKTMATRREMETALANMAAQSTELNRTLTARLDELSKAQGDQRSRLDLGPPGLAVLQTSAAHGAGEKEGAKQNTAAIVASIATVGVIISIVVVIANTWPT